MRYVSLVLLVFSLLVGAGARPDVGTWAGKTHAADGVPAKTSQLTFETCVKQ